MKTSSTQMVNGTPREMVYGWQRQIAPSDIIERWHIEGEGGNSTVRYTPYFATRGQAKARSSEQARAAALPELVEALRGYAACRDGCTCGDGWSHEPAREALKKAGVL